MTFLIIDLHCMLILYILSNAQEDALYCTQPVYIVSTMRRETVLIFSYSRQGIRPNLYGLHTKENDKKKTRANELKKISLLISKLYFLIYIS